MLLATPLSSAVGSDQAMGLAASGELGPRIVPDGHALWLPQSQLIFKVHVIHHADATRANLMYRAHFYRPDDLERP
jgi:hypothetical protein